MCLNKPKATRNNNKKWNFRFFHFIDGLCSWIYTYILNLFHLIYFSFCCFFPLQFFILFLFNATFNKSLASSGTMVFSGIHIDSYVSNRNGVIREKMYDKILNQINFTWLVDKSMNSDTLELFILLFYAMEQSPWMFARSDIKYMHTQFLKNNEILWYQGYLGFSLLCVIVSQQKEFLGKQNVTQETINKTNPRFDMMVCNTNKE